MSEGAIQKKEIVEADLPAIEAELRGVAAAILLIAENGAKVKPIGGISDIKKSSDELTFSEKELAKQHQELGKITAKLENFQTHYNKEIIKTRVEINNQTAAIKQQIVQNNALDGSYDKLNATLNQTIREYKALSQADRDNVAIGGQMIKSIQAQDAELKKLDATMGRNQRNVGNYKSGFNGLNFSIMQIGRELPSLAYGFNVFVGAISNNLPMVTDEIKRARLEIERAKIAGEKSTPIWKQLTSAIFSWQTFMVVGITIFTMYGREIAAWATELFKGKKAVDELRLSQERLNKVKAEGRSEAQSELTRLGLLWGALKDVNTSAETRNKIYDELKEKYPSIFKNLSDETLNLNSTEKAYWQLRDAIMASAKARVYAETIAKNQEKLELELKPKLETAKKATEEFFNKNKNALSQDIISQSLLPGEEGASLAIAKGIVEQKYKNLIKAEKEVGLEILRVEADNFRLFNMVDVGALTDDFGVAESKRKDKKEKSKKKIGLTIGQLKKEFSEEDKWDAQRIKEEENFLKDEQKRLKDNSSFQLELVREQVDLEILTLQEGALEKIRLAKGNKEEIEKIQYELNQSIIRMEYEKLEKLSQSGEILGKDYLNVLDRLRGLNITYKKNEIDEESKTEQQKRQIRNETMQATNALLQQGLEFSQMIYSSQAERAQRTYNEELEAAGDNVEGRILAERKFEAEDKKIKRRQSIADKLQAIFNAGLNLALAISDPNLLAKPLKIAAAIIGLGMAVATPIPAYAMGVDFHKGGKALLGDGGGSELVEEPSGKKWLSAATPTVYDLERGSRVLPKDETRKKLADLAMKNVRETVDMKQTNEKLDIIARNTKQNVIPYSDGKGNSIIKRGSITSTICQ